VFCAVLCTTICTHTYEQFFKMSVGLGFGFIFVCLFKFSILCVFFWFSLFCSCVVCFHRVTFSFFSVLCQQIGWKDCLHEVTYCCVKWRVKPSLNQSMLVRRAWIKAAPVENFLRVLVCLRILIRDMNLQKRFVEQDGVAIVTQVHSSVTYLLRGP